MRSTQTCPKCSGKRFAVQPEFRVPDSYPNQDMTWPFRPFTIPTEPPRFGGPSVTNVNFIGQFESWTCLGCGYTEFYAYGLDKIEEAARKWPHHVRIVGPAEEGQGPYR